ncbi:uncharacterized protein LOC111310057 [Durio zibethinus]|uniref:Uncharacterized protein LOC111310057 n=1 Tax=Durio zibethinus TaxID=66656 RepID=A0A6P6AJ63_DURZI|nr:uncharacterized protein LOC111310057 [Durio zibethinus]
MLFNASNTIYYRQARALKELATRLFLALKTDPENFETEASMRRMGVGRRSKADIRILNCNSNNKNNTGIGARGHRAQRGLDDFEVEKRQTYRAWNSFLSENGSLVSAIYNSPKQLKLDEKVGLGYIESLKRFAKDLGPTAQMATMKKLESYISEALRVWNVTTNRQHWAPEMQIPNAAYASNIKVAPSFKVPSTTSGCQNISGDKMDFHSGFSNVGQAPMDDTMNINNSLNGGISQPGGRVESLGDFQEKMTQSESRGFAPSLNLLGNSNRHQTFAGAIMDSPSSLWNGGKVSTVNNIDMNDAFNKGKGKLGNIMDVQEKVVQPMRGGLDSGAAFKDYAASESNGVHLASSFPNYGSGKGKLDFSALWNTKSNQKELGRTSMIVDAFNVDSTVQTAGQASLWSRMRESTPTRNSSASTSLWRPPSQVLTGLNNSQAIDYMSGIGSHYPDEGSRYINNVEQGGLLSDLFKPVEMGPQSLTEYCFQEQTISPEMASLMQQKEELDSLCEVPPLEDWLVSFPQEHVIRASSNALEYERFQPQSRGESSSRAAADRGQKQPVLGKELQQWTWL